MFRLVRGFTLALVLLSSAIVVGSVTAASSAKPTVSNFKVSPLTINYTGGPVTLSATVKNATRCIFTTTPAVAGVYKNIACSSGKETYVAKLPKSSSTSNTVYTFKLIVTGQKGDGNVTAPLKKVTVVAAPKPAITSFTTSNSELPSVGGLISLTGVVTNPVSCNIVANPAIEGTSSNNVPCSNSSSAIASIAMPPNNSLYDVTYTFTLTVTGYATNVSKTVIVTVDSNPPQTTTTTTPPTTTTTNPPPPTVGNTVAVPAEPDALALDGSDIWVASCSGNAVREINDTSKQIMQTITGTAYGFNCPDAIVSSGSDIWIANKLGNSITEINASTGAWVQTLTGSQIFNPVSLAIQGNNLWIANNGSELNKNSVLSEFSTVSGAPEGSISYVRNSQGWVIVQPSSIAIVGTNLWMSDESNNVLTEFSTTTDKYERKTSGGPSMSGIENISYHSGLIWATAFNDGIVVEYNASSGVYIRTVSNVLNPNEVIFNGTDLFVISDNPVDSIREYNSVGTFLRTIAKSNKALGKGFSAILLDGSSIWAANYSANSVTKYNI